MSDGSYRQDRWYLKDLLEEASTQERLEQESALLREDNVRLRAEMKRREADAYEHGLGDAAEIYRMNKVLVATIAALTDRNHPLMVSP